MEVVREVAAKKPILAMKAGRTAEGAKAAASHTGGLAKEDIATDLIFEKAGILSFRDEADLCQAAATFASQPIPRGNRVGIITNTGGPAVIATDVLVAGGLTIPPLSKNAAEILKEKLFAEASINNPLDVLATAAAGHFRTAMDVMMGDEEIDSIYINFVTPFFVDTDSIAKEIAEVNRQRKKPIICNLMTDKGQWTETVRILKEGGVPCYSFPGTAARALVALTQYNQIRNRKTGEVKLFDDVDRQKAEAILEEAQRTGRKILSAADGYGILKAYGIPAAEWRIADSAAEVEKAANEIGFPVVVKLDSQSVPQKSDVGAVVLNLQDVDALRPAVEEMDRKFQFQDRKFLVQKYLPGGKEVIVGAKAEDGLGHLVMFGIGGIYVEIFKDVVFKLSPVTDLEAQEMLSSLKTTPLLKGVRGEKGVCEKGIIEVIQRLSQLVTELPVIREMDLNPVIAFEDGVFVADARIGL